MRSWLLSPAVALIGLTASVVTLVQLAVAVARWVCRAVGAERSRVPVWAGLAALVLAVSAAGVEWPRVMAEAVRLGNGGLAGAVYPVTFAGPGVVAALALMLAAVRGERPGWYIGPVGVLSLWIAAAMYAAGPGAPSWGLGLAFAAPAVLGLAYAVALLARLASRAARAAA